MWLKKTVVWMLVFGLSVLGQTVHALADFSDVGNIANGIINETILAEAALSGATEETPPDEALIALLSFTTTPLPTLPPLSLPEPDATSPPPPPAGIVPPAPAPVGGPVPPVAPPPGPVTITIVLPPDPDDYIPIFGDPLPPIVIGQITVDPTGVGSGTLTLPDGTQVDVTVDSDGNIFTETTENVGGNDITITDHLGVVFIDEQLSADAGGPVEVFIQDPPPFIWMFIPDDPEHPEAGGVYLDTNLDGIHIP